MASSSRTRVYNTRIDRFRVREGIAPGTLAHAAGMPRGQLRRYLAAENEPRCRTLAVLLRSARDVTGKPVRASDLYDLGEDEPLGEPVARGRQLATAPGTPNTRFYRLLVGYGVQPRLVALESGLAPQMVGRIVAGKEEPRVGTLARLVRTLRRMGVDVRANDLIDIGDDTCAERRATSSGT